MFATWCPATRIDIIPLFLYLYYNPISLPLAAGESRGVVGLHRARVPPAEPRWCLAGAESLPHGARRGAAQPPGRHAVGAEEKDLRQREPGPPGLCPQLPETNVHSQHDTGLRGHVRSGLQYPRGEDRLLVLKGALSNERF